MLELNHRLMKSLPIHVLAVTTIILPARASLVGHWQFEEGSGSTVSDSSGLGNHGTLVNAKANTWTNGMLGSALYFPGVPGSNSTHVAVLDSPSLRIVGDISLAAWVRCDDIRRDAPVLVKEGDGKLLAPTASTTRKAGSSSRTC